MEKNDFFNLFDNLEISHDILFDLAFKTGLIKRKRIIDPSDLLFALCLVSSTGAVSHNDVAAQLQSGTEKSVSRVAIWKKVNLCCVEFLKGVLEIMIVSKLENNIFKSDIGTPLFNKIKVQDSTIISLPQRLFSLFSGISNGTTTVCNARIQGTYDIVNERFISFSIDKYSKNDFDAAPELNIEKGDLTLRDRGYFTMDEVKRHIDLGADCIYRYKNKMILLKNDTLEIINIVSILKKKSKLDINVRLNNKDKTMVRLVALPVTEEIANARRRKIKKDKRTPPDSEYLELLGWSIYITTITKIIADSHKIYKLYRLRWRIEIIFKAWKGNMNFDKIHNVSENQLMVILLSRFIMIVICMKFIFSPCKSIIKKNLNKNLSLLKVTNYLIRLPNKIIQIIWELYEYPNILSKNMKVMARYCSYDKRNKRTHYEEDMNIAFY
jgi:hypothetical protein